MSFITKFSDFPSFASGGAYEDLVAVLDTGTGLLEIFSNAPDVLSEGALRHIAFAVDDVDVCVEAVRSAGYKITMEPRDIVIASNPPYPARIAFCDGPVGESVEFFMEK